MAEDCRPRLLRLAAQDLIGEVNEEGEDASRSLPVALSAFRSAINVPIAPSADGAVRAALVSASANLVQAGVDEYRRVVQAS
jgi:hypothetical protein